MCKLSRTNQSSRLPEVMKQLIYQRTVLEKLKPLDKKLKYQIDKLVKLANHMSHTSTNGVDGDVDNGAPMVGVSRDEDGDEVPSSDLLMNDVSMPSAEGGADPLSFRPDPSSLLAATESASGSGDRDGDSKSGSGLTGGSGIYRAPRITATQLDDHERATDRRRKALERASSRTKGSSYLQFVRNELSERPEEGRLDLEERPDQEEMERNEYEERNLLRLTDTRKDKARKKEKLRASKNSLAGLEGDGEFDDFRDFERMNRSLKHDEMMSSERMEELQYEAMNTSNRKRGRNTADSMNDFDFDDPSESRHAKKRKGPNGKNSFGSKFKGSKGKGKGRR